jgi:predicted DNA-binding protein (MmcQ/YjbR family)
LASRKRASETMRSFALGLPGAFEDFPWGERVIKVNKKIFAFLGMPEPGDGTVYLGVKLPESAEQALSQANAEPTGYGLGKAGWVSMRWSKGETPPIELCCDWIEESYRAVAPKKLVAELDAREPPLT